MEMIMDNGYHPEQHTVQSDGYYLTLHRIQHGKGSPCLNEMVMRGECKKPVAFIQHGLLSSSADFLIAGPRNGLAYILADAGYDVWMGNFRGNSYSRRHESMSPTSRDFWKFSWHELGTNDLPRMIDYVLAKTGQKKLHYIGHSQGTTTFLVMTSKKTDYNDKIRSAHLMAPIAYMSNLRNPFLQAASHASGTMTVGSNLLGSGEFMPNDDLIHRVSQSACRSRMVAENVCSNAFFLLAGFDSERLDSSMVPKIMERYPAGSSARQVIHYIQEIHSGRFCPYDYGYAQNMEVYSSRSPPEYRVEDITAPISLYYGKNDWLAAVQDVEKLKSKLQNVKESYLVPHEKWNHIDFLWASDAKDVIYDRVIDRMRQEDRRAAAENYDSDEGNNSGTVMWRENV